VINIFKKKKIKEPFTPSLPLTWWIDDLTHKVCGLVDDPERGLFNMPWPDCEKIYVAIDKTAYDDLRQQLADKQAENDGLQVKFRETYASYKSKEIELQAEVDELKTAPYALDVITKLEQQIKEKDALILELKERLGES
jgi:hypothetical protein